jgi:hypothetical protein
MKQRAFIGVVKGVLLCAVGMSLSGCVGLSACSTVGYLYTGPAVIEFSEPVPKAVSVAACLGEDCEPAALTRENAERWEVPQEAPYLGPSSYGDGSDRTVHVVVTQADGAVLSDESHEIPIAAEKTGLFGQCPGPFSFEPVSIVLAG